MSSTRRRCNAATPGETSVQASADKQGTKGRGIEPTCTVRRRHCLTGDCWPKAASALPPVNDCDCSREPLPRAHGACMLL